MKRAFTQKVKITPSCAAESSDASSTPGDPLPSVGAMVPTAGRHRRTAAMIGLAISMGATGLLLPQGEQAIAAESSESPVLTPPTSAPEMTSAATQVVEPEAPSEVSASAPTAVLEHKVQQGESLWDLSQAYTVAPEAIAASNDISDPSVLTVGQTLRIPSSNGIVHQVQPGETLDTLSRRYSLNPNQISRPNNLLLASAQLPEGEAVLVPGDINTLQKARQDESLNRLKARSRRVNSSLAELRSEESPSYSQSVVPTKPLVAAVPSASTVNQAEGLEQESVASSPVLQASTIIPVPTPETSGSSVNVLTKPSTPNLNRATLPAPNPVKVETATFPSPTSIPAPTPEVAVTPTRTELGTTISSPISIPVPTPEVAVTPAKMERGTVRLPLSGSIPAPTPEVAVTPARTELGTVRLPSPIGIPVPTPEVAATTVKNDIGVPILPTGEAPVVSVTTPPAQSAPSPLVASIPAKTLYQVRRGDTLNAIARRYGVSTEELIRANEIGNPNQIRVNQRLTIPSDYTENSQTVAVLPALNANKSDSTERYDRTRIARNEAPNNVLNAVERENLARTYIERLSSDITRMRDRYRNGQDLQAADNVVVPTAPVVIPSAPNANLPRPTIERNQPFNFNRQPDLRVNGQNQRSQNFQAIQIPVPTPESPNRVAAAPTGSDTYNPALRVPVGETVSPYPSNQSPEQYFPGNPSQMTGYIWPTRGTLTSGYGRRWGRMHRGIDIAAPIGTPVMAAAPGVVVSAGWNSGGYGNLVEIRHPDGSMTRYAHNNRVLVSRGQIVEQGQQISEMGSTGRSTGSHSHFEVHPTGQGAVNPIAYLPRTRS